MGCGTEMIKYLLFIFNFIFAICGLGILVVGVLVHLELSHVTDSVQEVDIRFPAISMIVVGSIIFVISFFGCCGAIRESHCMTVTFASFLLFILLVQVAIGVYTFVLAKNEDSINIKTSYQQVFDRYYTSSADKEFVDIVQGNFQCCGVNGPKDFISGNSPNRTIPWSCCNKREGQICEYGESYKAGCVETLSQTLQKAAVIVGGIAIGIAGVELIGIIFALCLANSIRNAERRGYRV
ncbi:tetraspanin 6 isoform X1 [Calliopsis andreniformis]|uniref:tetraspanin 6 isoform X1 n=1 Tax=Calliopsis andreniformis TaxID=337506 RepID=UPI003FCCD22A